MKTYQKQAITLGTSALAAMALCSTTTHAQAQTNRTAPTVTVNSESVDFPGQQPVSQGGRVLVPLRGVLEKLGAYVQYDTPSRTVTAIKGDLNIRLPLGSREATVNQRPVTLDVPAQSINGSTLVPLRFVAESLGANVDYNVAANAVAITVGQVAVTPQPAPGGGGLGQAETIVGNVVAVYADRTPRRIVLRTPAGRSADQTIPIAERAVVSLRRNGEDVPVTLARVEVGDRVSVRKNPRGVAQSITIITRRQTPGGGGGGNARTFEGRFDSFGTVGTNRFIITTQDARTIEVPANVPIVRNGRRLTIDDLRNGDQLTVDVNPNNGRGTRIVVEPRR